MWFRRFLDEYVHYFLIVYIVLLKIYMAQSLYTDSVDVDSNDDSYNVLPSSNGSDTRLKASTPWF